ncbi:MAG: alpha/beta hydrolase [Anaerolineae bacterium]
MNTTRYVEKYLPVDGGRITYITVGNPAQPPLLLVHGWLSSRHVWRNTIEAFKDTHYCIALDLLGLGDSDKPHDADYSIAAQAARVLALADALGLQRFSLMGHSMGGQISLYIAAKLAPERVVKLVDVDGVVTGRLTPVVEYVTKLQMWMGSKLPMLYDLTQLAIRVPVIAKIQFRPWFHDMDNPPFDFWAIDRRMSMRSSVAVTAYDMGKAIAGMNLAPFLGDIQVPTLVIFGDDDGTVPVPQGQLAAERIPNAKLVIVPACGHFPMYEKPAEFVAAVQAFLQA